MNAPSEWQLVVRGLALAIPATYLLTALLGARPRYSRQAIGASSIALALSLLVAVGTAVASTPSSYDVGVRLDLVTSVMLVLVTMIGLVIARYSRTYLSGEPGTPRYRRWLLATLGSVTLLVIANNLLVIALAWTISSIALHQLLTFYDRSAALVAAHKKFLVSRLADVCFWSGIGIVYAIVGSLDLDTIAAWAATHTTLPPLVQFATVLFVIAVCLKSAQLPFHGWLTQVMEAPTPVSALLHAGVVNIGGFLMIRLAPLMVHVPVAQMLLILIGMTTAVLAALVLTTRVSVKVALAWSTCAQMGFMLVQCGLGAWHLALLHIVAHSLYKAHAFLRSGSTVETWRVEDLGDRGAPKPLAPFLTLGVVTCLVVAGLAFTSDLDASTLAVSLLVGLSLIPLLQRGSGGWSPSIGRIAVQAVGATVLYVGWHIAARHILPAPPETPSAPLGWAIVAVGFAVLFGTHAILQAQPHGRFSRRVHHWLFNGFHLDERFTRMTFRIWPPRTRASLRVAEHEEPQS